MESGRIPKPDAASRQLDVAIALLFAKEDVVAVHTLAAAAGDMASERFAHGDPGKPWVPRSFPICGLDGETLRGIFAAIEDALGQPNSESKPEKSDPSDDYDVSDTLAVIDAAVRSVARLRGKHTIAQTVFQLWYVACDLESLDASFAYRSQLKAIFGGMSRRTMNYCLTVGREKLIEEMERHVRPAPGRPLPA